MDETPPSREEIRAMIDEAVRKGVAAHEVRLSLLGTIAPILVALLYMAIHGI